MNIHTPNEWNDDRVVKLKELDALPLSSAAIAKELNRLTGSMFSRNAIIGKRMRLGLGKRSPGPRVREKVERPRLTESSVGRIERKHRQNRVEIHLPQNDGSDVPIGQRRLLLDLTNETCRYPFGEPSSPDFFYCGAGGADLCNGVAYCPAHMQLTHDYTPEPRPKHPRQSAFTRPWSGE